MATGRTRIGIVGAGPAGLLLSHLLHGRGIESVVLESRSRAAIESTIRAGVLEQTTVDLLTAAGVGERLTREGFPHRGINLRFDGQSHRIDLQELTGGKAITIYAQHEVIKDLVKACLDEGGEIRFGVTDVHIDGLDTTPTIRYRENDADQELACDFIAGCDGSQSLCRSSLPEGTLRIYEKLFPFGWFAILAEAPPSSAELVYVLHERGFALVSTRSPKIQRLYFQCALNEKIEDWSEDRIWAEFRARLTGPDGWAPKEGRIFHKTIIGLRAFVAEPMQYGRLFLAGDAAHVFPPTGAKGLNNAIADARVLAEAIARFYADTKRDLLDAYSATCLRRVWHVENFACLMTSMLHRFPDDGFEERIRHAQLRYACTSRAASASLAENYVGLYQLGP